MKKLLAIILAMVMLLLCVACNGTAANEGTTNAQGTTSSDSETSAANTDNTEYPVINITFQKAFSTGDSEEEVERQLNEIFREKLGCEVDITLLEMSNFATVLNLMLTGDQEAPDIFTSSLYQPIATLQANGQLMDITDYMDEYAPDIVEYFSQYDNVLECASIGGRLYGVPNITTWSSPNCFLVKETDAINAGVDFNNVTINNFDELTEILLQLKAANPDAHYIPGSTGSPYFTPKDIDYLADTNFLGVLMDPCNDTTVVDFYSSDYFEDWVRNVKTWKENDIIIPDPMSNTNGTLTDLREGKVNGTPGYSWSTEMFCYEANLSQSYGDNIVGAEMGDRIITTGNVTTMVWHVSSFCENPELAVAVLNMMYCDPDVSRIISCGVEGKDFIIDENGLMNYPEGMDRTTVGWPIGTQGMFPNNTLHEPWYYQASNINELQIQSNKDAKSSLALGFVFNIDDVADEYAACANVVAQYFYALINGAVDYVEVLPQFQQALKDNGIDTIIAAKQSQLDAWLAAN